jgi:sn-glycerol 3-phosphate transport system substrate-binding protein
MAIQSAAPQQLRCTPPDSSGWPAQPIQLEMWSVLSATADLLINAQVADFNSSHDAIHITLTYTGSADEVTQKLATGERPDLLAMGIEGLVNLTDAGIVTNASRCIASDPSFQPNDLLPIAAATYQLRRQQIAVPLSISTPVLFYNRSTFARGGLNPDDPPQSLPALRDDLQKLLASGAATQGLTFADGGWFISQWAAQLGVELAGSGNGHDIAEHSGATLALDGPQLREALDILHSMAATGLVAPKAQTKNEDLFSLLDPGHPAAMAFHTSGSVSRVYDIVDGLSKSDAAVGVGPLPGPGKGGLVGGSALWITTSVAYKVWPTWTAIRFFTDSARQAQYGMIGYAPARLSSLDNPALQAEWVRRPGLRVAFDQLIAMSPDPAHLSVAVGTQPNLAWRLNWAGEDITDISRHLQPADALAHAQRDASATLSVYNALRYASP